LAEKRRTDDDWRDLGEYLYHARKGLAGAWIKSSEMFGGADLYTRKAKELYEGVGELMVKLDDRYSHDDREWTFGNPDPIFGANKGVESLAEAGRSLGARSAPRVSPLRGPRGR
jgi:hypothetical protein